jgi:hypothetical protein
MLVGLTPAFPSSTAVLGHEQDWLFRVICQELIGYDAEPILEPVAVSMQPDENWGDDLQESSARAFSDGTIEGKRFFTGANIGADNIRDVDLVGIWYRFRQMLTAGTRWPREVGGSTGSLLFALGLGNIAGGRLVLPDETGKRHLTAAEWRTPAHLNRIPMWTSRGEWDPTVEVDDLLEREFASLARVLQCIWYDRLRSQVREWSQR